MKNKLYVAVTKDRYELPMFIADTQTQLSEMIGVHPSAISRSIKRGSIVQEEYRVVEVDIRQRREVSERVD